MSRYDWERGTLTLPTKAVAAVKKAVRDEHNACAAEIYAACKQFWTEEAKRTRSEERYQAALERWEQRRFEADRWRHQPDPRREFVTEQAVFVLEGIRFNNERPRQVTLADLTRYTEGGGRKDNRTKVFAAGEAFVLFEGRKVTYSSGENNHQVERARSYPIVRAFFSALDRVKWTRGSGGELLGNDEYNEDAGQEYGGGGGSYVTARFGPLGGKS